MRDFRPREKTKYGLMDIPVGAFIDVKKEDGEDITKTLQRMNTTVYDYQKRWNSRGYARLFITTKKDGYISIKRIR